MISNEPPLVLVKTWLDLIKSNEQKEIKEHATKMLISSFGSLENVVNYCNKHGLKLN
tara:strand:- start:5776 stop:5946 length:171 start_codon:yes stop_codon:yes gene_type:complete